MDNIIVYVDDASHAVQTLHPMLPVRGPADSTRWIVVGCAPRVTHHVSKFVTHSARDSWRRKWSEKVFGQVVPLLHQDGDAVVTLLAQGPLLAQTEALIREHGTARVLDARRPKFGQDLQPVSKEQAQQQMPGGAARYAAMLAGVGLLVGAD
jgi:hypothetical protein